MPLRESGSTEFLSASYLQTHREVAQGTEPRMTQNASLNVVLYQPEIPQNTGNIGRTCVAVGAHLWIVRPTGFRLDDHHLRRSGLDYWQHLQWHDVSHWSTLEPQLPPSRTFFFTKKATRSYTEVQYELGDYFVFGQETLGLPDEILQRFPQQSVSMPMTSHVRSLNLSNCVAVAVYEAIRQWKGIPNDESTP